MEKIRVTVQVRFCAAIIVQFPPFWKELTLLVGLLLLRATFCFQS